MKIQDLIIFLSFLFFFFVPEMALATCPPRCPEKRWSSSDSLPHSGSLFLSPHLTLLTQTKTSIQPLDYEKEASATYTCSQQSPSSSHLLLKLVPQIVLGSCMSPSCLQCHLFTEAPPLFSDTDNLPNCFGLILSIKVFS